MSFADTSRILESGVGWVSLSTPKAETSIVFEGGHGDDVKQETPSSDDVKVTDVLVGVASPAHKRSGVHGSDLSNPSHGQAETERSRSELLDELGSVLRARPLPPTCEKRLPVESQQLIGDEDEQLGGMTDSRLSVLSPPSSPKQPGPPEPVFENAGSRDLLSELRAQLSLAANEEIFSSGRDHYAIESDAEEDSILVQHEGPTVA